MSAHKKWTTKGSRYIVNDRWLKLRADTVATAEGNILDPWYVLEYGDWLTCLVIDDQTNAIVIRQYRHGAGEHVLELVGGYIDSEDDSPEDACKRELLEEIGYKGGKLYRTGASYANPASQTHKIYSFMAVGGSCSEQQSLGEAENIVVEKMPVADLLRLMGSSGGQEIYQSYNLANLFLAIQFVKNSKDPALQKLRGLFAG